MEGDLDWLDLGYWTQTDKDTAELTDEQRTIILGPDENNTKGTTKEAILLKWHWILGHINP
eukprot:2281481-Rhodomonas_salina.1